MHGLHQEYRDAVIVSTNVYEEGDAYMIDLSIGSAIEHVNMYSVCKFKKVIFYVADMDPFTRNMIKEFETLTDVVILPGNMVLAYAETCEP